MARTAEGTRLTAAHREIQGRVKAGALRDFLRLGPIWDGTPETFRLLVEASVPLIENYHSTSSAAAASYYEAFRSAERPGGSPALRLAEFNGEVAAAGLWSVGQSSVADAIAAGRPASEVLEAALTRVAGSVTWSVLDGGRSTVIRSTSADQQAQGWARTTSGSPCAFCAMLSGRGPVYKEDTADFEAHLHCNCGTEPHYRDAAWPGRAEEFRDLYNRAVDEANAAGDLRRGTSNDLLNAFRREFSRSA